MSEPAPLFGPLKPATTEPRIWDGVAFVANRWRTLGDDEPFPTGGFAIISLARWRAEKAALAASGAPVGIFVQAAEVLDFESDDISRLTLIALQFPKFTDGRAYSTARRLRETGYTGDIHATGDVLLDQLPLMLRAGFSSFEITNAATQRALEAAPVPAVLRVYQSGSESIHRDWRSRRAVPASTRA